VAAFKQVLDFLVPLLRMFGIGFAHQAKLRPVPAATTRR
jgi:hypothetical protein